MTAVSGRDFLLKVNTGAAVETLGGMRTTALTINHRPVDVSNKTTGGWRHLLAGAGIRSVSVAAQGVFEDTQAEETMRSAVFNGLVLDCELAFGNGDVLSGLFIVSSYERAGDYDGEETYSVTLEASAEVTFNAA